MTKLSKDQLKHALRLYAVSDSACLRGRTLSDCAREVIAGGATMLQYRNKAAGVGGAGGARGLIEAGGAGSARGLIEAGGAGGIDQDNTDSAEYEAAHDAALKEARELQQICAQANIPFIVNDCVQLAKEIGAQGVHVGQGDMPCKQVRELMGEDAIIGVSAQTVGQALRAQEEGADYLGVGAMVPTPTKPDAVDVSMNTLREIIYSVEIPVVAIGGINAGNLRLFQDSGIAGVAVVSALFGAENPRAAAHELLQEVSEII